MTTLLSLLAPLVIPLEVCPKAPPGAQRYANDILGYVLWGVGPMFSAGLVLAIGAMPIGRWLGMHGATKLAVPGILPAIVAAILQ